VIQRKYLGFSAWRVDPVKDKDADFFEVRAESGRNRAFSVFSTERGEEFNL
jgi:hypothetical protein